MQRYEEAETLRARGPGQRAARRADSHAIGTMAVQPAGAPVRVARGRDPVMATLASSAAAITGMWKLAYTTENGLTREATLDLKLEGDRLSGTLVSDRGTAQVETGKVCGEDVSFSLLRLGNGDEITVNFWGKVEGATMKLKMQYGRRQPVDVLARRTS